MTKYYFATIDQKNPIKGVDAADTLYLNENNSSLVLLTAAEVKTIFDRRQRMLAQSAMRQKDMKKMRGY